MTVVRQLQEDLFKAISGYKPIHGEPTEISHELKNAYFDLPRHEFIDRFKLINDSSLRSSTDEGSMEQIYSNQPLMYVRGDGSTLHASNSEPAFILHLLSLLDVKPGQTVLEIGCGTGWLLALISRLIGQEGRAVGVEIEPILGSKAQQNLSRLGINNAEVLIQDGNTSEFDQKFDRVIFTASTYFLPEFLWNAVADGGKVVVPFRGKGPAEEAFVLQKSGEEFRSIAARLCRFVPMSPSSFGGVDPSGMKQLLPPTLEKLLAHEGKSRPFLVGDGTVEQQAYRALPLTAFLSKIEPQFEVFAPTVPFQPSPLNDKLFGGSPSLALTIMDEREESLAVWRAGSLITFNNRSAAETFERDFDEWCALGKPLGSNFSVVISRQEQGIEAKRLWKERRGLDVFHWYLH
ncbi:methyltransferase domain-containing protein [Rhizobium sp. VS19-DR104.2]|uniref:protein-L-isoaspartate O-methyltransferase family protein n=1 Tax=unclassified Rhizobium TaxID=2613769 RepID=UPI001C5A6DAD|nr:MULTISPECIES: methyltransferase domain-containing protein [unclassified Rhizobium]MBZ5763711.1 methyltransferase domain-containing protein [Rhizobium sp. VS19-DR96]MBZ5769644.1 methyltransferase domain-containing protein [Rhizobium sp. VS19-DR129.2]MBZ5777179.1 methyltransferase domain-containing protein [Rhizobium sp. VS19-DRK62.2]MBZ5788325.1 methyltransferase domain-containing protein [Rhizobium sp. VS19-DR121]MBZ5805778.1 methyltransferase domain-containing protein [Rhizobium sp. VS19-D